MKFSKLFTIVLFSLIFFSCENTNEDVFNGAFNKGELGTTSISSISSIRDTTVTVNCLITYKGKGYLLARGVCWGITQTPTIDSLHITVTDTGQVALKLPGLKPGILYYVRPYMTNKTGTSYGDVLSFTTKNKPTISTLEPVNLTSTSVTIGGNVTADGGDSVTVRGICWNTSSNPDIALTTKTANGAGKGTFSANITNLTIGTTYYARAYATNSFGTVYGNEITFTTQNLPTISTTDVTNITTVTATSGGNISSDGGSIVIARGICWGTSQNPTIDLTTKTNEGIGIGSFSSTMVNLQLGTTYYVRAYATNLVGTAYGQNISFKTINYATVTTTSISNIGQTTASCSGNVSNDGGANVISRGVCWSSTTFAPKIELNNKTVDGTGLGIFSSSMSGLIEGKKYYVRAYATNSVGTSYGDFVSFTTNDLRDIDGNIYHNVTIGTQVWLVEDLKTTHFRDGTSIPLVSDGATWGNLSTPAYCWHNNNIANKNTYGALYNWYTVNTGKLAPAGWHVPTDSEWFTLINYLGGVSKAGPKLKEAGTTHWLSPNTGATNETGFSALPCGYRDESNGIFSNNGNLGYSVLWWSTTENGTSGGDVGIDYLYTNANQTTLPKKYGISVRCIKD